MIGLFAYYAKWIQNCTELTLPLTQARECFSSQGLTIHAQEAIKILKNKLVESCLASPDFTLPLTIETDASDKALGGTLLQLGRPVAFFSRTLSNAEKKHAIVEKEAAAIVECCRRWKHLINSVPNINIITDQRSISLIFNKQGSTKIKNDKLTRWRIELADINYTISYRPGHENTAADALSRCCSIQNTSKTLYNLHSKLCHPGIKRMLHYCKTRNLPYSTSEIKQLINKCNICNQLKPRFYKPPTGRLIQSTRPWERLSMDFIGPLQSTTANKYMLVIVDEYSRYPFAFPCHDITAETVIRHLLSLFSLFGSPSSIHADRGTQFESVKLLQFLERNGVIKTRTTPYHPQGNGQCERTNGTILKAISLALKTLNLGKDKWEVVLQMALSSIRGLLCTELHKRPRKSC
jgi:transposase InsO family protein